MSSWHLFRDGGEWSGYEGGDEWQTQFRTREALEAEIRRKQTTDLDGARQALAIAQDRLRAAEERLAKPVRIRTMAEGAKKAT